MFDSLKVAALFAATLIGLFASPPGKVGKDVFDGFLEQSLAYERSLLKVRKDLLDKLTIRREDAKRNNDEETRSKTKDEIDALNSRGAWPDSIESNEERKAWAVARDALRKSREDLAKSCEGRKNPKLASAIRTDADRFDKTNDLAMWRTVTLSKEELPARWSCGSNDIVSPAITPDAKTCEPWFIRGVTVEGDLLVELTVERLHGSGGLILGLPGPEGQIGQIALRGGEAPAQLADRAASNAFVRGWPGGALHRASAGCNPGLVRR